MWQAQAAALILYVLGTGDSSWAGIYKSAERDLCASSAARRSSRLLRPSIDHLCPTYGFPSVLVNSLSRARSRPPVNCCSILVWCRIGSVQLARSSMSGFASTIPR